MKKITPACRLLMLILWYKFNYFNKKCMLSSNGSFYYDDKRLSLEVGVSIATIRRMKKYLTQEGYIHIKNGVNKGKATEYWVLRKPGIGGSFIDISRCTNSSLKGFNQSPKGSQNDTPNKVTNNDINKEYFNVVPKAEDLKNGIVGLIKLNGVTYAKNFYISKGFGEAEVKRILSELGEG